MTRYLVLFDPTSQKPGWEKPGKIRDPPLWDGFPTFTGFEL